MTKFWLTTIILVSFTVLTTTNIFIFLKSKQYTYGEFSDTNPIIKEDGVENINTKDTVYFVGDVMLARHVEHLMDLHGADYPYKQIQFPNIENSYLVGNFESSISPKHAKTPNFTFQFSTNSKYIPNMRHFGFTHLSLANNHSFDFGREGYLNAVNTLQNNDIVAFGHPTKLATTSVTFLELKNHKLALIGLHNLFLPPTENELQDIVSRSSKQSDLQIAYVHWGTEYLLDASNDQKQFAEILVKAGFDLIIGHHPHVVQGIDKIAESLVFYSLGNFIFDQYFSESVRQGLVLTLKDGEDGVVVELLPITSQKTLAQPSFMNETDTLTFIDSLSKRSQENLALFVKNQKFTLINKLATSTETAIMAE